MHNADPSSIIFPIQIIQFQFAYYRGGVDQQDSMKTRDTDQTKIKLFDVENFLNYTPAWFKQFLSKAFTVYTVQHVLIFFIMVLKR